MSYLLDTCVFAEYDKRAANEAVLSWVDSQPNESLYISVLTIGEIEKGIVRMPPSRRRTRLTDFLNELIETFDGRILAVSLPVVRVWGTMIADLESRGRPMPAIDSLLSATAIAHDLTMVTRNSADFANAKVKILDIWK